MRYAKVVYPYALQTQSDDKILLTGFFSVMRLLPSGDLDPSFGNNGLASLEGENTPELTDVQVQRDGKIILAGKFIEVNPTPASLNAVVARLQPDGSRDKTWGNDGILRLRGKAAFHTTFDAQGNTLAVGHIDNGERTDIVVYRILRGEYVGTADRPDADQTLLNVFPNPVSEEVSVAYDLLSEQEVNIRLYDSGGRQVHTLLAGTTRQAGQHTEHLTLPPGLTAGLYTLSILTSKGQVAVQIVVQP